MRQQTQTKQKPEGALEEEDRGAICEDEEADDNVIDLESDESDDDWDLNDEEDDDGADQLYNSPLDAVDEVLYCGQQLQQLQQANG